MTLEFTFIIHCMKKFQIVCHIFRHSVKRIERNLEVEMPQIFYGGDYNYHIVFMYFCSSQPF